MTTALTPQDDANVEALKDIGRRLMTVADGNEDLGRYLAYRYAALAILASAVALQQQLIAAADRPVTKTSQTPWYSAGKRAYGKAYGNGQ